jgi:hypothetical protein
VGGKRRTGPESRHGNNGGDARGAGPWPLAATGLRLAHQVEPAPQAAAGAGVDPTAAVQPREKKSSQEISEELGVNTFIVSVYLRRIRQKHDAWERRTFGLPALGDAGWLMPSGQWQPAENRTCPHRGPVYAMQSLKLIYVASEKIPCQVCGRVLYAWRAPYDYKATLLECHDASADRP